MRLLVCGPRNLGREALPYLADALLEELRDAVPYAPGFVFAHGAAPGADSLWEGAFAFVADRNPELWTPVRRYPARWREEGRAAGPLRNERMLREVQPTRWLAAHWEAEPSTPGTRDMVQRLRGAGVHGRVVHVPGPHAT